MTDERNKSANAERFVVHFAAQTHQGRGEAFEVFPNKLSAEPHQARFKSSSTPGRCSLQNRCSLRCRSQCYLQTRLFVKCERDPKKKSLSELFGFLGYAAKCFTLAERFPPASRSFLEDKTVDLPPGASVPTSPAHSRTIRIVQWSEWWTKTATLAFFLINSGSP